MKFDEMDKNRIADLTNDFYTEILNECQCWYGNEEKENVPFMVEKIIKNLNIHIDRQEMM
jgi:hypothetical protein